jgi:flagellar FliL protein
MTSPDPSGTSDPTIRTSASGRWIRLLIAGVVVGGITGATAFFAGSEGGIAGWVRAGPTQAAVEPAEADGLAPVSAGAAAKDSGHIGSTYALQTFVVNILDRDRDRYLKLKAELELEDTKLEEELSSRLPQIRDLIIGLLGSKTFDDIRTIEGKNFLREEMLLRINALLVTGKVRRIFFTEFVVQ